MRIPLSLALAVAVAVAAFGFSKSDSTPEVQAESIPVVLSNVQSGELSLKPIGRLSFGAGDILLVTEPKNASVVAIQTGDKGPLKKLKKRIDKVDELIAKKMGSASVLILDMAVNPKSGTIFLAVRRKEDQHDSIITVNADGELTPLNLKKAKYVRVSLPSGDAQRVTNITDIEFASDRVIVAGQCNEEFSSKIYTIPFPLTHGSSAKIHSAKTYHVAHGRWETRAPIQSLIPYEQDGKSYVVGSFACTPIAKFPLDDVKPGAQIVGESVVELGSGNRPLDMFTYEKDGRKWLVTNTDRFHHKRRPIGPSQYWGCRVDLKYLEATNINKEAVRRNVKEYKGPEGIEVIESFFGVRQVDKLSNEEAVVLRDNDGHFDLEITALP